LNFGRQSNAPSPRQAKTVLIAMLAMVAGCTNAPSDALPVPKQPTPVVIERLDRDLFHAPPDSMASTSLRAYARYGDFYRVYIEDILQGAPIGDQRLPLVLHRFVRDPDWSEAQRAVDSVLGDLAAEEALFTSAFARLKAAFPDSLTPRVIAFNAGYNYGIFPTDSVLGVGVEWFIGKDHPVIGYLAPEAFPQYVKARMEPAMLVPSAMKGWLLVHYTRGIDGEDLLANLVETGKVLALLDALLAELDLHLKLAFSPDQLAWCEANEYEIWKQLVAGNQLFSKKPEDIGRWMSDGPFTNGLPRESPGHIGEWIGLRMVQAYRKANPELTFAQLLALRDDQAVLRAYKPR